MPVREREQLVVGRGLRQVAVGVEAQPRHPCIAEVVEDIGDRLRRREHEQRGAERDGAEDDPLRQRVCEQPGDEPGGTEDRERDVVVVVQPGESVGQPGQQAVQRPQQPDGVKVHRRRREHRRTLGRRRNQPEADGERGRQAGAGGEALERTQRQWPRD